MSKHKRKSSITNNFLGRIFAAVGALIVIIAPLALFTAGSIAFWSIAGLCFVLEYNGVLPPGSYSNVREWYPFLGPVGPVAQ